MGLELRMLWRMFYHRQVHSFNVAGCAKLHIWIDWLAAVRRRLVERILEKSIAELSPPT